jgi:hypothetical protein
LLPGPIERLHLDGRIARIGAPGICGDQHLCWRGCNRTPRPHPVARLALDSYLIRAEPSLEKIRPRAALVRELDREKGAKPPRYRKAVAGLGVKNIDHVLGIVVESAEGELSDKPGRPRERR